MAPHPAFPARSSSCAERARAALAPCAFATACFLYLFALPHPLLETDTFFHLAVGREVATAGVPRADPFSWTRAGQPWQAHSWLFGWLCFQAHGFGGPSFVVWLAACALVLTVLVTDLTARASGCERAGPRYAAQAVTLLLLGATFCVRPHVLTGLFLAVECHLIARWRHTGARWPLVAIPPLCLVWANVHGGFALAALPLATAAVGAGARSFEIAAAAAAAALACCVNPWGITLLALPFRFAAGNGALRTIAEWMPPDLATCGFQLAISAAVLLLIAARARPAPAEALALAAATALWLSSRRHLPVFAVIAAPLLARALAPSSRSVRCVHAGPSIVPAFTLAAALALLLASGRSFLPPAQLPRTCVYMIQREPAPAFHEGAVGGYLIWQRIPVFIDWRAELYSGTPVIAEYNALLHAAPGWERILVRHGVRWVLIFRHRPLARALAAHPGWTLACHDERFALFRAR